MKTRIVKSGSAFKNLMPKELPLETEKKKLMIVEDLLDIMEQKGISRTELARRMGVQRSRITSMLNGTNNVTIETLVRAGRAVGAELHQTFVASPKKSVVPTPLRVSPKKKSKSKVSSAKQTHPSASSN